MSAALVCQISLRNLIKHRRRNLMLFLAILIAVAGVVSMNTLIRGMQYSMAEAAVENLTGHVKVHAQGYRDDPNISHSFALDSDFANEIPTDQLLGWAPRVRLPAVVMSERQTRGIQLVGVDPAREDISFLYDVELTGEGLADLDDQRVLIGRELAAQLETEVGRRLVIITQGGDGLNRERGYRIAGTYNAEGVSLEKVFIFTGINPLQALLETSHVTEVSIRLSDEAATDSALQAMTGFFAQQDVADWQELEPTAAAMFLFADAAIYIWFLLMMSALVFGLINTLIASVMERVKEFGLLRALGMARRLIVAQVVVESTLIMTVGLLIGTACGYGIYLAMQDGIDLSAFAQSTDMLGMSTVLVPRLEISDLVLIGGLSLIMGLFASIYPAVRAVKIEPLEAMRN
ncbi:MAG: FtsX-like permease family protein [Pseudomonadota bacterium]